MKTQLAVAVAIVLSLGSSAAAQQRPSGEVGIVTDMWAGTDAKAAQDLEIFDSDDPDYPLRIIPMGGRGAIQNLKDIIHLPRVDMGFVPSDAIAYAQRNHLLPPADLAKIQYVAKLYNEEVHLLAGPGIRSIGDLKGKKINVDVPLSGSALTADVVLGALNIDVQVLHKRQADGLMELRAGKIDAILQVGGAPVPIMAGLPLESGLHLVPIPDIGPLADTYLPTSLTHQEYPNLIPDGAQPVDTIAIGDVLAVFGWRPGTSRYQNVARFVEAMFSHFSEMQQPPRHPKWAETNLAATVPGWTRFPEAEKLAEPPDERAFMEFARTHGLADLPDSEKRMIFQACKDFAVSGNVDRRH